MYLLLRKLRAKDSAHALRYRYITTTTTTTTKTNKKNKTKQKKSIKKAKSSINNFHTFFIFTSTLRKHLKKIYTLEKLPISPNTIQQFYKCHTEIQKKKQKQIS